MGVVVGALPPPVAVLCPGASSGEYLTLRSEPLRHEIFTGSPITNRPTLTASFAGTVHRSPGMAMRESPSFVISPVAARLVVMC